MLLRFAFHVFKQQQICKFLLLIKINNTGNKITLTYSTFKQVQKCANRLNKDKLFLLKTWQLFGSFLFE